MDATCPRCGELVEALTQRSSAGVIEAWQFEPCLHWVIPPSPDWKPEWFNPAA